MSRSFNSALLLALLLAAFPARAQFVQGGAYAPTVDDVTARPPTANDDTTKGYAIGDFWCITRGGGQQCWQAERVTAGLAMWTLLPPPATYLDAVVVPNHAWSTHRIVSTFASNGTGYVACAATGTNSACAFALENPNLSATYGIPFGTQMSAAPWAPIGNLADFAKADGNCPNFYSCSVANIFDQTAASGAGANLQYLSSAFSKDNPVWHQLLMGGERYFSFDGMARSVTASWAQPILADTTQTWNTQSYSVAFVGRVASDGTTQLFGLGNSTYDGETVIWKAGALGPIPHGGSAFAGSAYLAAGTVEPPGDVHVYVYTSGTGRICWYVDGRQQACSSAPTTALTDGGVTANKGFIVGGSANGAIQGVLFPQMDFAMMAEFSSELTQAQVLSLTQWALGNYSGLYPQKRNALIVLGDSGCEAPNAYLNRSWPAILADMMPVPRRYMNACIAGTTYPGVQVALGEFSILDTGKHIVIIEAGNNDLSHGMSPYLDVPSTGYAKDDTVSARLKSLVTAERAIWPNDYLVLTPTYDRGPNLLFSTPASGTVTATTASGNPTITITARTDCTIGNANCDYLTGFQVGMNLTGVAGIPGGSTIASMNWGAHQLTLSANASASGSTTITGTVTQSSYTSNKSSWDSYLTTNCVALLKGPGACLAASDPQLLQTGAALNTATGTATWTGNVTSLSVPGFTGTFYAGGEISGTGIPIPDFVTSVVGSTLTLAYPTTGSQTAVTVTGACDFAVFDQTHPFGGLGLLNSPCGGHAKLANDLLPLLAGH